MEARLTATMELRDGRTGELVFRLPSATFSRQHSMASPVAGQLASETIEALAEKVADSFIANLLANDFERLAHEQDI